MNNNYNITGGVYGEYLVRIIKANGDIIEPFGPEKRKNLILDSFLQKILDNGYSYGIQSFIQTCRVGDGTAQPLRTQNGLVGQLVDETSASSYFLTDINEEESSITLKRDFIFPIVSVSSINVSEGVVGSFGMQNVEPITISRFVFPGIIQITEGDRLTLTYTLKLQISYLTKPLAISLIGENLDFGGYIRMSSNKIGITSLISGSGFNQKNTYIPLGSNTSNYAYRDFTVTSNTTTVSSDNLSGVSAFSDVFGTSPYSNKIGFFGTEHYPVNYPTGRLPYNTIGDLAQISKTNLTQTDSYSSIDIEYSFPPDQADRQVDGLYLSYNTNQYSNSAIYYKFNNTQTIEAEVPVKLFLRWSFGRI